MPANTFIRHCQKVGIKYGVFWLDANKKTQTLNGRQLNRENPSIDPVPTDVKTYPSKDTVSTDMETYPSKGPVSTDVEHEPL